MEVQVLFRAPNLGFKSTDAYDQRFFSFSKPAPPDEFALEKFEETDYHTLVTEVPAFTNPPNHATQTFSTSGIGTTNPPTIQLISIPASASALAPPIVTLNQELTPRLRVTSIRLTNISGAAAGNSFVGEYQVGFDNTRLVRAIPPVSVQTSLITTGAGTKTIVGCASSMFSGVCPTGQMMRGVATDGSLICAVPPAGGTPGGGSCAGGAGTIIGGRCCVSRTSYVQGPPQNMGGIIFQPTFTPVTSLSCN